MRFDRSKFVPLMVHTALDPGDAVALPGEIVQDCRRMGFRGCALIGRIQLLAVHEALRHMQSIGSQVQGRFKVAAGMEVMLQMNKEKVSCVLLARDQIGWRFLLSCMTRPAGWSGEVQLELTQLKAAKGHVILLVRPTGAGRKKRVLKTIAKAMQVMVNIKVKTWKKVKRTKNRKLLLRMKRWLRGKKKLQAWMIVRAKKEERAIERRVPTAYLALSGMNHVHEQLGIDSGLTPVAAPDIHLTRLGYDALLADWRALHDDLLPLDPQRCLTLSSCRAVAGRFPGGRKLLARSGDILDAIENFDFFVRAEDDPRATQQLADLVNSGMRRQTALAAPMVAYQERLREELAVIEGAGMARQFVAAATVFQKLQGVGVPLERHQGHLANSLVARSLSLTTIDPIRDGLVFRNFLRPWAVRRPSIRLTVGSAALPIIEAHLSNDYVNVDRPLQVNHLGLEACAEKVGARFELDELDRMTLHAALRKAAPKGGSKPAKVHAPPTEANNLMRAIAITPLLAKLPWQARPHPTELLVNSWRPTSRGHRIAPIASEDASALGYLPISIEVDPAQDAISQKRLALTAKQQKALLESLQNRDDPKAIRLAIDMWSRDKRLYPTGYLIQELMLGPGRPDTFSDLVVLHGFLQDRVIDRAALLFYFKLNRRDDKYLFFKQPILKSIMAGTRGQVLWNEQCFRLMVDGLKMSEEEAFALLDIAAISQQRAQERWQEEASKIKEAAYVPRNPPVPPGRILNVKTARSSQRREMYERNQMEGHPPMSHPVAEVLHVIVGEAFGRTRSKALAIAAAMRSYEQALLQLM